MFQESLLWFLLVFSLLSTGNNQNPSKGVKNKEEKNKGPQKQEGEAEDPERKTKNCFNEPSQELVDKLNQCINDTKDEWKQTGIKRVKWHTAPRLWLVQRCYFEKLNLTEGTGKFHPENVAEVIKQFKMSDDLMSKVENAMKKCEEAKEMKILKNLEAFAMKALEKLQIDIKKFYPTATKEAAHKMFCIRVELEQVCQDLPKFPK